MIKSYSNQKNRRQRPENLVIRVKAVLPDNISSNVKNQITEVLASTKFSKLPINIFVPSKLVFPETGNDEHKPFRRGNNFISAGFIRNYFIEDKSFEIMVFSKYAEGVSKFKTPAIEIIFMEVGDELVNIVRFNIIDVDEVQTESDRSSNGHRSFERHDRRNTSYKSPTQNSVPLDPRNVETNKEKPLETPKTEPDSMGVTIGDMLKDTAAIPPTDDNNEDEEEPSIKISREPSSNTTTVQFSEEVENDDDADD